MWQLPLAVVLQADAKGVGGGHAELYLGNPGVLGYVVEGFLYGQKNIAAVGAADGPVGSGSLVAS